MKLHITSAELIRYNANIRGKDVGDCVKRALSLALGSDYSTMEKELNAAMKAKNAYAWNVPSVFDNVIKAHGGSSAIKVDENIKLSDFVDKNLTEGTFLVRVGQPTATHSNHIVAVIDGEVYDSWDCRNRKVFYYYIIDGSVSVTKEIDIRDKADEIVEWVYQEAHNLIAKNNFNIADDSYSYFKVYDMDADRYTCQPYCKLKFAPDDEVTKSRSYMFEFKLVVNPYSDPTYYEETLRKTLKTRMYDRFYAIVQQEKAVKEEYAVRKESGNSTSLHFYDERTRKFYNSLPGWVKGLATYVDVTDPGQYSDSYTIKIKKLPNDTTHSDHITFEWYDASSIRDMLDRYKEKFEVPHDDYDPQEEY